MPTPLDQAIARVAATMARLELEAQCVDQVMGSDKRRWELLAAIAALDPEGYRYFVAWTCAAVSPTRDTEHVSTVPTAAYDRMAEAAEAYLTLNDADTPEPKEGR